MARQRNVGVSVVRGPFVEVPPHPFAFDETDENGFLAWAQSVKEPKAMDLFCGAGGLSLGLADAGYEVVLGVDHDREALETHRSHSPGLSVNWDLADDDVIDRIVRIGRSADVQLVAGGPPCQPFSKAGRSMIRDLVRSGRREHRDERRDLWQSFLAVVEGVQPKAVLMENVPDMALDRDIQILRTMVDILEDMDYSVSARVVESSRYEVPQHRQRLILVALADNTRFEWPEESGYQVTLKTAIGDLPKVEGGWRPDGGADGWAVYDKPSTRFQREMRSGVPNRDAHKVFDHITRPVREDDKVIFEAMDSGTSYSQIDDAVAALDRITGEQHQQRDTLKRYRDDIFDDKYKRLDWNQLSRTITAHIAKDGYWYIHPDQDRTLTIREAARVQTFPDDIRFSGPPSASFRQIGNAVPPRLGRAIAEQVLAAFTEPANGDVSTAIIARRLAGWFVSQQESGSLRLPWLSPASDLPEVRRWAVLQGELLLGRCPRESAATLWPLLEKLSSPRETIEAGDQLREMASWIDRQKYADRLLEAAAWLDENPESFDSIEALRHAPHVTEAIATLAVRVGPGPDEDPVLGTAGLLRVAARYFGSQVDRKNPRTDGRISIARLIGAEDSISDDAYLALLEIAESVCTTGRRPHCAGCPLSRDCSFNNKLT